MVKVDRRTWKKLYFQKIEKFFSEYSKIIIVNADNVGSKQLQHVRILLRDSCEILFGKNTLMRAAITKTENEQWMKIIPYIKGNVGLIFTNGDLAEVRNTCIENNVSAPARVGAIAPCVVKINKGPSGLDAQKTSFFQAVNIQTKIVRGNIEIVNDVKILNEGDKVGPSEAVLLNMLGLSPFNYSLIPEMIYDDGALYEPKVLDLTEADIIGKFMQGVSNVAAVSLALGRPNSASVPHMVINGYKNVLAIALATDITFPQAEKAKAFLADPSAFIVAAPATTETADAAPEPEEEEEEESDDDMDGFSLFD